MHKTLTTEQRFEHVDHQFGVIDKRSERMEFRTDQRLSHTEDRLNLHDQGFLELRNSITDLAIMSKNQFDHVYEQFDHVDERFDDLKTLVKQGFERMNKLETLFKRTDNLESLIKKGFEQTDRLEGLVKEGFERTDRLESLVKQGFGIV